MKKCIKFGTAKFPKLASISLTVAIEVGIIIVAVRKIIKEIRKING
jgi:hypothetical protein